MRTLGWLGAILAASCSTAAAATLHVDTFETGALGWGGGGLPAAHVPSGGAGDDGGYIRVPSATNFAALNGDARWSGDYASIGASKVVVNLRVPTGVAELELRAVLFGPSNTQQRYTSAVAQTIPADGVWREYTFSLAPGDIVPTQVYEPPLTHSQVMGNVLQFMLRHDPGTPDHAGTGVTSELHIDNIALAAASVAGDFDGNGVVNAADLNDPSLGWKQRYGTNLGGDDFLVWQRALSIPLTAAVPEPATLGALSVLFVALVGAGGRRRRGERA